MSSSINEKFKEDKDNGSKDDTFTNNLPDRFFLHRKGYVIAAGKSILGEGTYSKVRKAYSKELKKDVAIKIVSRTNAPSDFVTRFFPRELEIIKDIDHRNICKYYDIIDTGKKVYMVMDYASNKDLLEYIQANHYIMEKDAKPLFTQVINAVEYLHSRNILHRDIKCENILLNSKMEVLLTDFSFSKQLSKIDELNRTYCGSSAYAAIEILKGTPYDGPKAEVWSLGCVLFVMLTGTMPFDDTNKTNQVKQMKLGVTFLRSKKKLTCEAMSLIRKMLHIDAKERLSLVAIKLGDWLQSRSRTFV